MIPQPIDQVPLFLRLSDEERELISSRLRLLEFKNNEIVFSANKPAEMLGVIAQGWIKLESETPQGRIALANLGAGSVIGEVDLLLNRPYSTTARAASATSLHTLSRKDLQDLILESPTIGLKFSHSLGSRVAFLDEYLVTQRLGVLPLLSSLTEPEMRAMAHRLQFRSFQRGDTIFEAGEAGDAVFLIEEGTARLVSSSHDGESYDEVRDGEIIGQTALIASKPYLATARAVSDLSVWVLTRADYQDLIQEFPAVKIAFSRALAEGLSSEDQAKAVEHLRALGLFTDVDGDALRDITSRLVLRHFPAGETIYAEGTPGDAMYFIESGEVRHVAEANGNGQSHEVKRAGESFGEMALLTGRTRSEAAKAIEDTTAWVLYKSDYDDLIVRHPTLSLALSRALSGKLSASDGETAQRHLPQLKLLSGLSPTELKQVGTSVKPLRFRQGETICYAGQPAQYVYLIETGEVRAIAGGPNGQAIVLELLGADQSFGERAVFSSSAYSATMQAVGEVGCLTISKADFDRLLARCPSLALNVARQMAEDAEKATRHSSRFHFPSHLRSNGNGRSTAQPSLEPQAAFSSSPNRPPAPRVPSAARFLNSNRLSAAPAVGVRTAPSKPWERSSNSVMRPMPAATTRPISVAASGSQGAPMGYARQGHSTFPGEAVISRFSSLSTGSKVKLGIIAFFAFWLLIILPLGLIASIASSSNFLGAFSGKSQPSEQLPANLQVNSPKISALIPGVGKLAVRAATATPLPKPTLRPAVKAALKPAGKPTAKPLVVLKAKSKPTLAAATPTPSAVAQAAAVIPPLPPRIWDSRLGAGGLELLTGVGVTDAVVSSGQEFWRLVKMQFQDAGAESGNDHTIYISIVDENGSRVKDASVIVSWDDAGKVQTQRLGIPDEKPAGDFCKCNYNWPMYGAGYRVKIDGSLPSDQVYGMIMPEHRHVNYLITFQRVIMP